MATINSPHPDLVIDGRSLDNFDVLKLLGVLFDKKLTIEKHIRSTTYSIAQKVGILQKCKSIYDSQSICTELFSFLFHFSYLYLSIVIWRSAADTHLKLLDRSINMVKFRLPDQTLR